MTRYVYYGPVFIFDERVNDYWKAETYANTKAKALNNLCYQYTKQTGLAPNSKILLDITKLHEEGDL